MDVCPSSKRWVLSLQGTSYVPQHIVPEESGVPCLKDLCRTVTGSWGGGVARTACAPERERRGGCLVGYRRKIKFVVLFLAADSERLFPSREEGRETRRPLGGGGVVLGSSLRRPSSRSTSKHVLSTPQASIVHVNGSGVWSATYVPKNENLVGGISLFLFRYHVRTSSSMSKSREELLDPRPR